MTRHNLTEYQKDTAKKAVENLTRGGDTIDEWAVTRGNGGKVSGEFHIDSSLESADRRINPADANIEIKRLLCMTGGILLIEFDKRNVNYRIELVFNESDEE